MTMPEISDGLVNRSLFRKTLPMESPEPFNFSPFVENMLNLNMVGYFQPNKLSHLKQDSHTVLLAGIEV